MTRDSQSEIEEGREEAYWRRVEGWNCDRGVKIEVRERRRVGLKRRRRDIVVVVVDGGGTIGFGFEISQEVVFFLR